jgi:hypothetical protein
MTGLSCGANLASAPESTARDRSLSLEAGLVPDADLAKPSELTDARATFRTRAGIGSFNGFDSSAAGSAPGGPTSG